MNSEKVTDMQTNKKRTFSEMVEVYIHREHSRVYCRIDGNQCSYVQSRFDAGNFLRHFRSKHTNIAFEKGFMRSSEPPQKKKRVIPKRPVAIDKQLLIEGLLKMVAYHNMPLSFVEWQGFRMILDPIAESVGVTLNRFNIKDHLSLVANATKNALKKEMTGRLICLKIDSASRFNRHVLGINAQYAINDKVVIRTLAMHDLKHRQTASFLKAKILETLHAFEVTLDQVYSVTCDNGSNMIAAVNELKDYLDESLDASEMIDNGNEFEIMDTLCMELQEHLNLVRCAVHTMQLAVLDVLNKNDANIKRITEIAKKCKRIKYLRSFQYHKAKFPPVWSQTRWGGIFMMLESFMEQRPFFEEMTREFPELDLSGNWEFMTQYTEAFKPLHICTQKMQSSHVSLPDCYLNWLVATSEVRDQVSNPLSSSLLDALNDRLVYIRSSMVFKAALYMDPRFNFMNSTMFTVEEKVEIQNYIISTKYRINSFKPSTSVVNHTDHGYCSIKFESKQDDCITEICGGTVITASSLFQQQLKALESEPRQSANIDVWHHWMSRKTTHPELYEVASVVMAVPSNQVTVERAFSALALVLTDHRTRMGADLLENILLIKLNKDLAEEIFINTDSHYSENDQGRSN